MTTLWIEHWEEVEIINKVMEENTLLGNIISTGIALAGGYSVCIDFASPIMPYMLGKLVQNEKIKSMI